MNDQTKKLNDLLEGNPALQEAFTGVVRKITLSGIEHAKDLQVAGVEEQAIPPMVFSAMVTACRNFAVGFQKHAQKDALLSVAKYFVSEAEGLNTEAESEGDV